MIRKLKSPAPHVLAYSLSGTVTSEDYDEHLIPDVDAALESGPVRMVVATEDDFSGFAPGAALEDLRFGIAHRHDITRLALVSDSNMMRIGARLIAPFVPFEVKLFHRNELHAATDWAGIEGSQKIHSLNRRHGVVTIKPKGELDARQLEMLASNVDEYLKGKDHLTGVLLDFEHFPGWQNMSALAAHLRLIKDHRKRIQRIALSTDDDALKNIPKLAELFLEVEVRTFSRAERQLAREWLEKGAA